MKMQKSHWRSGFPEELEKFGKVIEVNFEPFYVREFADIVKIPQNWPEFFRVEAQYKKSWIISWRGNLCAA